MHMLRLLPLAAGVLLGQAVTPQDELLRLLKVGQAAEARRLANRLIDEAAIGTRGIPYRAGLFQILGTAQTQSGQYLDAERALRQGLKLCEAEPAAAPRIHVSLFVLLADVNMAQGQLPEAGAALRRALAIAENALPAGDPALAGALAGLGTLHLARGQLSQAETAYRKSLAILETALGPAHPDTSAQLGNLAGLLIMTGREAQAVPMLERAADALRNAYGPASILTITVNGKLAVALTKQAPARAESILRETLSVLRAIQPILHPETAAFLNALAWTRYEQKDLREAIALNEQAVAIAREAFGANHSQVMTLLYARARLLKAGKRGKESATAKAEADRIRVAMGYPEAGRHTIDIHSLARQIPPRRN